MVIERYLEERVNLLAEKADFFVDGYHYATLEDANQAQVELKKAEYFETKLVNRNAQNVLTVYDKILDKKVFVTPAGWEYLKKMQEKLRLMGIQEDQIRPIPMYGTFVHNGNEGETTVRQRIKPIKKRDISKERLRISVLINIFLIVMVIAMFSIALNSNNPNILNYKSAIENEYASWEQDLTEREKIVRQKEAQLEKDMEAVSSIND